MSTEPEPRDTTENTGPGTPRSTGAPTAPDAAVTAGTSTTCGGGGIFNSGTLTLGASRVSGNTVVGTQEFEEEIDNGGGAVNSVGGALNVFNSSVTWNTSSSRLDAVSSGPIRRKFRASAFSFITSRR